MKILACLFTLCNLFAIKSTDLETVRKNYDVAVANEAICQQMITELKKDTGSSVNLAYLGAFQAVWANHVFNPFSKLKTFNEGKAAIERAVKKDPTHVEIRFIRLSIQKNCPGFLGYTSNIEEDKQFINNNKKNITSSTLKKMVESLLSS